MKQLLPLLAILLIAAGCGDRSQGADSTASKAASSQDPSSKGREEALVLRGSNGSITLGDPLDKAKKAFPAPKSAQVFETAMSFAILGKEGWTWGQDSLNDGFEAAAKDGKVVAIARVVGKGAGEREKAVEELGEPARKAESKNGAMYVWESGDRARILVLMGPQSMLLANGAITMIGRKADLKLLNYDSEDPATFVRQMDAMAAQAPEIKKAFEKAIKDAKAKAGN